MNDMGKPFTEEERKAFVRSVVPLVQRGQTWTGACKYLGIAPTTFEDWLQKFPEIRIEIDKAEKFAEIAAEDVLTNDVLTNKSTKTAKWLLERLNKDKYSRRTEQDIKSNGKELKELTETKDNLFYKILDKMYQDEALNIKDPKDEHVE